MISFSVMDRRLLRHCFGVYAVPVRMSNVAKQKSDIHDRLCPQVFPLLRLSGKCSNQNTQNAKESHLAPCQRSCYDGPDMVGQMEISYPLFPCRTVNKFIPLTLSF